MPFCMECGTEMYEQLASDPTQPFDHVDMISIFVQLSHMNLNISLHTLLLYKVVKNLVSQFEMGIIIKIEQKNQLFCLNLCTS